MIPGVPDNCPEVRTGASIPSFRQSVPDSSTWLAGRSGPSTRTLAMEPLGPVNSTCSSQANWPGWLNGFMGLNRWPGPNSASTSSLVR